jgi:uncharacterized protein YfkK (UPF0435 family)
MKNGSRLKVKTPEQLNSTLKFLKEGKMMITVSTKQLVSAIEEAEAFKIPAMNAGTEYLYNSVYNKLAQNMDVRLSALDFEAFELEDIDSLTDIYSNVFERNCFTADKLASALRSAASVSKTAAYV